MNKKISAFIGSSLLSVGFVVSSSSFLPVNAFTFTNTGSTSGGNPGGQPIFAVGMNSSDVGNSFTINWGLDDPVLSAVANFTLDSLTENQAIFTIDLLNNTELTASDPDLVNAAILSMGFGVDPDATGSFRQDTNNSDDTDVFDQVKNDVTFAGFQTLDICVLSSNNCAGGNVKDGLQAGDNDEFQVILEGSFANGSTNSLIISPLAIKFQTSQGSYELSGEPEDPDNPPPVLQQVPEPTTLLALGLLGFGMVLSRHRKNR
jgi:hypothetical protein